MKGLVRELAADLKAAARIGDPASLAAAFDRLRATGEAELPESALLPLGEALRELPADMLAPWLDDDDPAVRGAAAAALGLGFDPGGDASPEIYRYAADDPVPAVRDALAGGLAAALAVRWVPDFLENASPRVVHTGLLLMMRLETAPEAARAPLEALDGEQDHDVRDALVASLSRLAELGEAEFVLGLAERWAGREAPNTWVITRLLSASWAADHSPRCVQILEQLAGIVGEKRSILRALARHGAG